MHLVMKGIRMKDGERQEVKMWNKGGGTKDENASVFLFFMRSVNYRPACEEELLNMKAK